MRNKLVFIYALVLALCFGGYAVYTQRALKAAQTFYLIMEPSDPFSLMSGEYMQINYAFESAIWTEEPFPKEVTLYIDGQGVANYPKTGQPLVFKIRGLRTRLPHQFYFKEGTAGRYESAFYAQIKRLPDGRYLLSGLADKNLKLL